MTRCNWYAVDQGLVLDCVLPSGHDGAHDLGDVDWAHGSQVRAENHAAFIDEAHQSFRILRAGR